ncbi:hypothetical protein [Streptomyces sp. NPDC020607]|uniref:hypothetical protein n=1 Tax=Streptomyces sp. NPDC020607 TaxID=3365082 RepID=UPI00379A96E0
MNESDRQVGLYSGPNYTGDRCVLPCDGATYTLAATGLDKIASIKIPRAPQNLPPGAHYFVRLFSEQPPHLVREDSQGLEDFNEDTPDTEKWANSGWVEALLDTGMPARRVGFGETLPRRKIRDAIER